MPFTLLMLSLLALMVSLVGLVRTADIVSQRAVELHSSWDSVRGGTVEGSELVLTDRLISRVNAPVPVVRRAAWWSLGLACVSLALLAWVVSSARSNDRRSQKLQYKTMQSTDSVEQAAVMKLLDEMAPLASGDLRVKGSASHTMTGSLAEAFNQVVDQMRWLVSSLKASAAQIQASVDQSRQSSDAVAEACSEQSSQIHRSSNALVSMSSTMSDLSADAAESSVLAQSAVEHAETGAVTLASSLQRISQIHADAENTTRLMHRLADSVAAIDERVTTIEEVAEQTDLLALNTTIRASAGTLSAPVGDAASDLGRLSDEVAQLADVLGQATRDIGSLTRTISEDAAATVQSMEHTTARLNDGVAQTQQISQAFGLIQSNSVALRERIVAMAERTVEQSATVRQLSENMDTINQVTRQTIESVSRNADSLDRLQELASSLNRSVSDFRLPADSAAAGKREAKTVSGAHRAVASAAVHE